MFAAVRHGCRHGMSVQQNPGYFECRLNDTLLSHVWTTAGDMHYSMLFHAACIAHC